MGMGVAVELIGDEQAENDNCRRIGPKLAHQEPCYQRKLHCSMAEQIPGVEMLSLDRKALSPADEVMGKEVSFVLSQLILSDPRHKLPDRIVVGDRKRKTADALACGMDALQQHADFKELMDPALLHSRP